MTVLDIQGFHVTATICLKRQTKQVVDVTSDWKNVIFQIIIKGAFGDLLC